MKSVAAKSPDAVLLAGLTEENGARLIKDKVSVLGANSKVRLLAPDGFAQQSTIDLAGKAAKGMYASVPGQVPPEPEGPGQEAGRRTRKGGRRRRWNCMRPTPARPRAFC